MSFLKAAGAAAMIAGAYGASKVKRPSYDMAGMDEAWRLIQKQYNDVSNYFDDAYRDYETQYQSYYGDQMSDAISAMASSGVFESPVSENALNRKRKALAETYAVGKSQLAGQKMSALGSIEQQKVAYYQKLSDIRYQEELANAESQAQKWAMIGSIGSALI